MIKTLYDPIYSIGHQVYHWLIPFDVDGLFVSFVVQSHINTVMHPNCEIMILRIEMFLWQKDRYSEFV